MATRRADPVDDRTLEVTTAASVGLAVAASFGVLALAYGTTDLPPGLGVVGLAVGATLSVQAPRAVVLEDCRRRAAAVSSVPGVLLATIGAAPAACSAGSAALGCAGPVPTHLAPALASGLLITAASVYVDVTRR